MRLIHSKEIVLYNFVCVFLNVFLAQNQTIPPGFNSLPIGDLVKCAQRFPSSPPWDDAEGPECNAAGV